MDIDRQGVNRILLITLSNVGDIILTTPIIAVLKREFPGARLDVMVGPRGRELFEKDPRVFKLIIYDKHISMAAKRRLQLKLKRLRYDLVVDIRNTIFPLLIGPKHRTGTIQHFPTGVAHSRERHLYRLRSLGIDMTDEPASVHVPPEDAESMDAIMRELGVTNPLVVINPGARSHLKRWTTDGFAAVAGRLQDECGASVVFIGQGEDAAIVDEIRGKMERPAPTLVDRTNIRQLAHLLKRADLLITNDSAPLHLGCAMGSKVLAVFGPTDMHKYGPTGEFDMCIFKKLSCSPCEQATCAYNYECMRLISADEVFDSAKMMLEGYE